MIRAVVVLMGLVFMAACSQFDPTPTAQPPMPNTSTPVPTLIPTPTPGVAWKDVGLDCEISAWEVAPTEFRLWWDEEVYRGRFFLDRELAIARFATPPKSMNVGCDEAGTKTPDEWRSTQRPWVMDCLMSSPDVSNSLHEFSLRAIWIPSRDENGKGDIENLHMHYSPVNSFYLLLDFASQQTQSYGQLQMEVTCLPTSVYPDG